MKISSSSSGNTIPSLAPFENVLKELQDMKVLLATHHHSSYQLLLSSWGMVLSSREKSRTKLLQKLRRSSFRGRSGKVLEQQYSPIPTGVVTEWLVDKGHVVFVARPAGRFLRLATES